MRRISGGYRSPVALTHRHRNFRAHECPHSTYSATVRWRDRGSRGVSSVRWESCVGRRWVSQLWVRWNRALPDFRVDCRVRDTSVNIANEVCLRDCEVHLPCVVRTGWFALNTNNACTGTITSEVLKKSDNSMTYWVAFQLYMAIREQQPVCDTKGLGMRTVVFESDPTGSHVNVYDYPNVCT